MNLGIIGDVGEGKSRWYHAGDEIMCISLCKFIKNNFPKINITLYSRSLTHGILDIREKINFFPTADTGSGNVFYFIYLFLIKIRLLPILPGFYKFVKKFKKNTLIIIAGGGNLNSRFPGYIKNRALFAALASSFKIPVIIVSQTIGPITRKIDSNFLRCLTQNCECIYVREKYSYDFLLKINPPCDTRLGVDDTFLSSLRNTAIHEKNSIKQKISVGLSLRDYDSKETLKKIKSALFNLTKKIPGLTLNILPHIFDSEGNNDLRTMKELFADLNREKIIYHDFQTLTSTDAPMAEQLFLQTAEMDILITTRYHGLIFGLAANIPTLALYDNEYYEIKMRGAYNLYFSRLALNLCKDTAEETALSLENTIQKLITDRIKIAKKMSEDKKLPTMIDSYKNDLLKKIRALLFRRTL